MAYTHVHKMVIALVLCLGLLLPLSLPQGFIEAAIPDIEEKQEQLEEAEQQKEEIEEQLKKNQLKESEILDKLQALEMNILDKEREIRRIEEEIEKVQENILETEGLLKETEESITLKSRTLEERVNAMYRKEGISYLQVLLSSKSFSDLLSNLDMIRLIANHDVELLEELESHKQMIQDHHLLLEEQQDELESLHRDVLTEKSILQVSQETQEALRKEVEMVIGEMENELEILEEEAKETAAEIARLQAEAQRRLEEIRRQEEEQRQREEEERRRQEEEERRRQEEERRRQEDQEASDEDSEPDNPGDEGEKDDDKNEAVTPPPESPSKLSWPVPRFMRISSPYGWRNHPISGQHRFHQGIDIPAPMGTPIVAAESGIVIMAGWRGSYGIMLSIDHGDGLATLYAHNTSNLVSVGDYVERGQIIARIGSTGNSTGPHLHFEVMQHGEREDPLHWVNR